MNNIMKEVFKTYGSIIGVMLIITCIAGYKLIDSKITYEKNLEKYDEVKYEYELYLDGKQISADNIDINNYEMSFDDAEKKVLLAKKTRGRIVAPIIMP